MRVRKKRAAMNRITTFITLFAILLTFSGFANIDNSYATQIMDDSKSVLGEDGEYRDIYETDIIEYRNEYEKHFSNEDNTVTAYTYANPIHYQDKDGYWIDIDNTLIRDDESFVNKNNPNQIRLSTVAKDNNLVSIKQGEYEIGWGIQGARNAQGHEIDKPEKTDRKNLTALVSKVAYDNVFENTSLTYTLYSYSISEDIIFDCVPSFDQVTYNIKTQNLAAVQEGNEVIFFSTIEEGKEIFRFKAPYMYDSAFALTYDITVAYEATDGGYHLTYVFDREWLLSEERVYPVTLDPTVRSWQHYNNIEDTHINTWYPNTNYVYSPWLFIGQINGWSDIWIKITTMPSIPAGSTIADSRLEMVHCIGTTTWGSLNIWELTSYWNSFTLTYNNQWNCSWNYLYGGIGSYWTGSAYAYSIDVTSTVRKWYNGTMANWGFALAYQYSVNDYNALYSSDHGSITSSYLPAISVTYSTPTPPTPSSYPEATSLSSGQYYFIKNANSGQYLTGWDLMGMVQNGNTIEQVPYYANNAQLWKVTHMGNGQYKISSAYNNNLCLDVTGASAQNGTRMQVYTDNGTAAQRFSLVKTLNCTYKIYTLTDTWGFNAVGVQGGSCTFGEPVVQCFAPGLMQTHHIEWIFEPQNYTPSLGAEYAKANWNLRVYAYPDFGYYSGGNDCTNFVSQCMLAAGKHFNNDWGIYKKNNTYRQPINNNQLNTSWDLSDPSPWISAKYFNTHWSNNAYTVTLSTSSIQNNPSSVYSLPFGSGDVIVVLNNPIEPFNGGPNAAVHTYYIVGVIYDWDYSCWTYEVVAHDNDRKISFLEAVGLWYSPGHLSKQFKFIAV